MRFPLGIMRLGPSTASAGLSAVNCVYAIGTDDWFGITNMRIHRPRMRSEFTALNDCEPPDTCAMASVRPCVGRTEPTERGIQSIWVLKTAVWGLC
jgi:hypothetical protein